MGLGETDAADIRCHEGDRSSDRKGDDRIDANTDTDGVS